MSVEYCPGRIFLCEEKNKYSFIYIYFTPLSNFKMLRTLYLLRTCLACKVKLLPLFVSS